RRLFHDARETTLEQQVWSPLLAHNEMANPSIGYVVEKIAGLEDYTGRFEAAFDGRGPGMDTIGMALAAYERLLVAGDSPFDRWRYGGDEKALTPAAQRGYALFTGKAGCAACHTVGDEAALFTDHALHSTGIGYAHSMEISISDAATYIAPGEAIEFDAAVKAAAAPPRVNDLGRYEVTGDPADRWKYRTPGLRNVALTAPYMHNGSLATLTEVIEFYNRGGVPHETLDPLIGPLGLSAAETEDIVAFLQSLTGASIDAIVADAFAAPVGNVTVGAAP
ncbi:MAG: c-type cytochrome, partial [Gammaproteobacteria bacterium]|nr:c-type cytochrome [Gammaproteobacteria bacterium]